MREKPKSKGALAREKYLRSNMKKQNDEKPLIMEHKDLTSLPREVAEIARTTSAIERNEYESSDDIHKEELTAENSIVPGNRMFAEVLGQEILLVMKPDQLNLFGQTFRPIFCGFVKEVTNGFITLDPVIIKMTNAPFHRFPTPLNFPMEQISTFTPFDCDRQIPLS